jgi:predicted DNA-binding transcriptional regulator YafY
VRRADRLFRLLLELRRGRVVTARELARRLEVSERTVYRDVADLSASGVPIAGEAGVGYRLAGFELPPLMFDRDEIEALALGARTAEAWGDAELATAARSALAKIEAVLPRGRERLVEETRLYVPTWGEPPGERIPLGTLRRAIRDRRKIRVAYVDEKEQASERTLRPLALAFHPPVWLLVAWCELREDFRSFRLDRFRTLEPRAEIFVEEPGRSLADYLRRMAEREAAWRSAQTTSAAGAQSSP